MMGEEDDDFLGFEPEEKDQVESNLESLESEIEEGALRLTQKARGYDYLTLLMVIGEIVILLYGLLILLR